MKRAIFAGATSVLAALTAACVEPPVKPIPEAVRQSVTAVSADVSGIRDSDTSKLGARGSDEGGKLGALQGAAVASNTTSLLGMLVLMPIGAAVGGAKGAAEARPAEIVDETRSNLRLALQETDFTELLRQRLATSKAAGAIEFSTVTSGSSSAPRTTSAGLPVGHVIALEYRLNLYGEHLVNPVIGVYVRVTAQVQSPDRKQLLHSATWAYCSDRTDFVQAATNNAAILRAHINQAAIVLGEAIPYDLYVSRQPRTLRAKQLGPINTMFVGCMDFNDLPSRTGEAPVILPPAIPLAPAAQSQTPPTPVAPTPVATVAPAPATLDGNWQIEMEQLSTTYGTTVGGECPKSHSFGVTFVNGVAEWPRGKLGLSSGGEISGWTSVPAAGTSTLPFIVNLSGRLDNGVLKGTVAGRCTGSFTMRKQASGPVPASARVASAAPIVPVSAAPAPSTVDGNWLIDMQISSTFCLAQSTSVTFTNRIAEGPWGKLQVSGDGELGGWMKLKPLSSGSVDYLVNLAGRLDNGTMAGTLSGRCSGTFTMKRQ